VRCFWWYLPVGRQAPSRIRTVKKIHWIFLTLLLTENMPVAYSQGAASSFLLKQKTPLSEMFLVVPACRQAGAQ